MAFTDLALPLILPAGAPTQPEGSGEDVIIYQELA